MGWTTVVNNMDWASDFLNEYVDAFNERGYAYEGPGFTPEAHFVPGDDVQAAAWFIAKQAKFNSGYWTSSGSTFVDSHNYPSGYHAWASWNFPQYTFASLCAAAGIPSGFRRITTAMATDWTNYNDPAYSYGYAQVGDVIGPWLFADFQAMLNKLVWTSYPSNRIEQAWLADNWYNGAHANAADIGCAACKAATEADWNLEGTFGSCSCHSHLNEASVADPWRWVGVLDKKQGRCRFKSGMVWTGCNRSADWYLWSLLPEGGGTKTYDANGENLVENAWGKVTVGTPGNADQPQSDLLPTSLTSMPNWCDCPAVDQQGRRKGWRLSGWDAVVRWNVTGGFVYV